MMEMDEGLSAYLDTLRAFATNELAHDVIEADREGVFAREAWKRCGAFGLQGLPVPEELGGGGADMRTTAIAFETLGRHCPDQGLLFSLNAQMWAVQYPLVRFGTAEQKQRYMPGLVSGDLIGAHAMSEPESGSDAFSLRTTARRVDGGFRLNGSKTFVTNAPVADLFVLFATTDPAKGFAGLVGFLIERDSPGLETGPALHKMGLRTSPMGEVFLDDCFVADSQVLGRVGMGMMVFNAALERERSMILAPSVGAMARALDQTIAYAKQREQFGQSIAKFQAVSHRIVDMQLRLTTSRLLLHDLVARIDAGQSVGLESALTKLHLSESYLEVTSDALLTHGGYGYMTEYEVERGVRDAFASKLYSGTSDIQRNLAARYMGL